MSIVSTIFVKTKSKPFPCTVTDHGVCRYCKESIVWGRTRGGTPIPLELFDQCAELTEAHFVRCPEYPRCNAYSLPEKKR